MTKKKRDRVDIKEILARPWCYYCERDFDDQKVLISHQKAKHFKCDNCNRRLNTAGGLSVHLQQVHKETLTCVANAIEGREKVEPEIFGMMGIPDELLEAHAQRTEAEFKRVEDERRALTGNPPPGQKNGEPNTKKRKIETPEELKARLQEHRAKRAAEKQAEQESKAARSASITPDPAQAHPAHMHQVSNFPAHTAAPAPYGAPPAFQFPTHPPPSFSPPGQGPYAPPQFSSYPPNYSPMPGQMSGSPSPPIGTPYAPAGPPGQMWGATPPGPPMGAPHAPGGPPRQMSGATPPGPPLGVPYAPAGPYRQNSLPTAPGLPRRPSFDVPGFNRHDMQRMHTGQALPPKPQAEAPQSQVGPPQPPSGPPQTQFGARQFQFGAPKPRSGARHPWQLDGAGDDADVDHPMEPTAQPKPLQQAENTEVAQPAAVKEVSEEASKSRAADLESSETKKKGKKQKPSQSKLVFNDKNESPEEKMATWRKFHFVRSNDTELVEGEVSGAVTGVTVDQDTVLDPQN